MAGHLSISAFRLRFLSLAVLLGACAASLEDDGKALLRFKEAVEFDPYKALENWVDDWGGGVLYPCSWFGVECSLAEQRVVALNLESLYLRGAIAPELGDLLGLKSLILHHNLFYGDIPREIAKLQRLVVLDLGFNNFCGTVPPELDTILSLEVLILRSNHLIGDLPPRLRAVNMLSEIEADKGMLLSNFGYVARNIAVARRRLNAIGEVISPRQVDERRDALSTTKISPSSANYPPASRSSGSQHKHKVSWIIYTSISVGSIVAIVISALYVFCWRTNKIVNARPRVTGLSGQLQKAFVKGVPALKRPEIQAACEDFSNIVGTLSGCTLYKGTLSSGVEIAVTSTMIITAKDWSKNCETQFRKKIAMLSKLNHKNFANLLGYCEDGIPFTRMMVFEYAPNGTLFEHLHIKEAEHLDWPSRLRVAMGVAYCLEYMHGLQPPFVPRRLDSSSIYITDDCAAKVSDLGFWSNDEDAESEPSSQGSPPLDSPFSNISDTVYKFGALLLELISGRLPISEDNGLLVLWASSYLTGKRPLKGIVDPTIRPFPEEDVTALCDLIRSCISRDASERPTMSEVANRLREITGIPPAAAVPRLSPLWWAELEINHPVAS